MRSNSNAANNIVTSDEWSEMLFLQSFPKFLWSLLYSAGVLRKEQIFFKYKVFLHCASYFILLMDMIWNTQVP